MVVYDSVSDMTLTDTSLTFFVNNIGYTLEEGFITDVERRYPYSVNTDKANLKQYIIEYMGLHDQRTRIGIKLTDEQDKLFKGFIVHIRTISRPVTAPGLRF